MLHSQHNWCIFVLMLSWFLFHTHLMCEFYKNGSWTMFCIKYHPSFSVPRNIYLVYATSTMYHCIPLYQGTSKVFVSGIIQYVYLNVSSIRFLKNKFCLHFCILRCFFNPQHFMFYLSLNYFVNFICKFAQHIFYKSRW